MCEDYNIGGVTEVKVAQGVLLQEQDGDAFLVHLDSGRFFGLNRTGLIIWNALKVGEDPYQAVAARWPAIDPAECRRDVDALVADLLRTGLATPADTAA
jgi:hypothetical protein